MNEDNPEGMDAAIDIATEESEEVAVNSEVSGEPEPVADTDETRDWEDEARRQGWRPDGPKDARTFVEDGEKYAVNLSKKLERQEREFSDRIANMERMNATMLARQRAELETRYEVEKRMAIEQGDLDHYDALQQEQNLVVGQYDVAPIEQAVPTPAEFITWKAQNDWFNHDAGARAYAIATLDQLMVENPGVEQAQLIPALDAKLDQAFPQLKGPVGRGRKMIDSGGNRRGSPRKGQSYSDLPREARAGFKQIQDEGIKMSEADYARLYFQQQGE